MNQETKFKVSYQKRWHPTNGTVYKQAVRIDNMTLDKLKDTIFSEIAMGYPFKEQYAETSGDELFYLKPLKGEKGICYLNCTQTRFLDRFLKLNLKRDRNTCLLIR
jgi:hypothetical protein